MKVTAIICLIACACFSIQATEYVLQQGSSGYSGCQDTWLWENTDGNHGGQDHLPIYRNGIRPLTGSYIPMIHYNLTHFDTATYFDTAMLSMYVLSHSGEGGVPPPNVPTEYRAYLMLKTWNAGTADPVGFGNPETGAVDFLHRVYPTKVWGPNEDNPDSGTYGPHPNEDYSMSYYSLATKDDTAVGVWLDFDIKSIAQFWVENPDTNYGLILYSEGITDPRSFLWLSSCEYATASQRPKLTLVTGLRPTLEDVQQRINIGANAVTWDADINSEYKVYYSETGGSSWDVLVDSIVADTTAMSVFDDPAPLDSRQYKVEKISY